MNFKAKFYDRGKRSVPDSINVNLRCLWQQWMMVQNVSIKTMGGHEMFSENLKTIRKAKGYTQEELAIKVNVVRQTVSKWEKGFGESSGLYCWQLLF